MSWHRVGSVRCSQLHQAWRKQDLVEELVEVLVELLVEELAARALAGGGEGHPFHCLPFPSQSWFNLQRPPQLILGFLALSSFLCSFVLGLGGR